MKIQLWLSIVFSAALMGCDGSRTCTLMACSDAANVTFAPPLSEAGDYEVSVAMADETITCSASLPLGAAGYDCVSTNPDRRDPTAGLKIAEGGSLSGIWIQAAPTSMAVTISRDGVELVSRTLEPAYSKHQPNGAECDGEYFCQSGAATLQLE